MDYQSLCNVRLDTYEVKKLLENQYKEHIFQFTEPKVVLYFKKEQSMLNIFFKKSGRVSFQAQGRFEEKAQEVAREIINYFKG